MTMDNFQLVVALAYRSRQLSKFKCFRNVQFTLAICQQKELPKDQWKPLYIMSAMALVYFGILPKAMIWLF